MTSPRFSLLDSPAESDVLEVRQKLREFNDPFWEVRDRQQRVLKAHAGTELVAGAVFTVFGNWLEIDFLWVDERSRGQSLGTELLKQIEALGREQGCTVLCLNTFSFQARPFYEKNGFSVVYQKENYPKTSTQYFMEKRL